MKIRIAIFISILLWVMGFSAYTFIDNNIFTFYSATLIKKFYSPVCHQVPVKCFTINNHLFLVCARCSGIYTGILISSLLFFFSKKIKLNGNIILLTLIIMLLDIFLTTAGVYSYSKAVASFTGLFFGLTLFIYILTSLEKYYVSDEKE